MSVVWVRFVESERIGENTLSDQSTGDSGARGFEFLWCGRYVLVDTNVLEVSVSLDGLALIEVCDSLSHKLFIILRFHIASVILVEVIELVVEENRSFHGLFDGNSLRAMVASLTLGVFVDLHVAQVGGV